MAMLKWKMNLNQLLSTRISLIVYLVSNFNVWLKINWTHQMKEKFHMKDI